ncbi:hypothetical protein GF360_00450 [candidate division WWE3 bacterium]|nr:hypothetical protein [candidate division WWE3 bacterium]
MKEKLLGKIFKIYKLPLLVSLTVFIVITALAVLKEPLEIGVVFLGSLLGTFFLDLDYIIYAYFTDMSTDFSRTLRGFFKHNDYSNAVSYIYYNKDKVKEKTLQSILFQIVIGAFSIFMVFSPINYFAKAVVISVYVNSLYRLAERYAKHDTNDWFWMLKDKPSEKNVKIYLAVHVITFLVVIQFL